MNINKILILSDFSQVMQPLLQYGLALAHHLRARVWIQHTYYIPPNVAGEVFIPTNALDKYEKNIHHAFEHLKERLPALQEIPVSLKVSYGDLIPEMNKLIEKQQIDLVIVGQQGGGFLTNILGSNTIKVIQHAHCPVLSVPLNAVFHPYRKIAWATDLQQTDKEVLDYLSVFARSFQAQVDIVHVSEAPVPVDVTHFEHTLEVAFQDIPHPFFHVHGSDVEKGIEQYVERNNNDILVLLPRAHSFFDRLFQKSITRQVAYQERVPLLSIHN